jgi:hypothetical protein
MAYALSARGCLDAEDAVTETPIEADRRSHRYLCRFARHTLGPSSLVIYFSIPALRCKRRTASDGDQFQFPVRLASIFRKIRKQPVYWEQSFSGTWPWLEKRRPAKVCFSRQVSR